MGAYAGAIVYADLPLERVGVWLFPKNVKKKYHDDEPWVDEYYRLCGWDIKGHPAPQTAAELGL